MTDQNPSKDTWVKDNSLFVCDGKKYGLTKEGQTVCGGPVSGATQTLPAQEKGVTTPAPMALHTPQDVTPPEIVTTSPLSDKIMALEGWESLGSRTIAKLLKKEGVKVSHMTISRALNKMRQKVLF